MGGSVRLGLATHLCLTLSGYGGVEPASPDLPALKKLLVGTWEWPEQAACFRMQFFAGDDVTISIQLSDGWQHSKTKYKLLSTTTLELTVGSYLFPDRPITQQWGLELTKEALRVKVPRGQWLTLKRRK